MNAAADEFYSQLSSRRVEGLDVLGPAECPLAVISGNHRRQLLVKSVNLKAAHNAVASIRSGYKTAPGVYLEIDVDPVSLL